MTDCAVPFCAETKWQGQLGGEFPSGRYSHEDTRVELHSENRNTCGQFPRRLSPQYRRLYRQLRGLYILPACLSLVYLIPALVVYPTPLCFSSQD